LSEVGGARPANTGRKNKKNKGNNAQANVVPVNQDELLKKMKDEWETEKANMQKQKEAIQAACSELQEKIKEKK